jgi:D-glycero-alpha-D-manno-heptose-7-phosphate kinase
VRRPVVAHAPTRLDFGGGWTDVPPYPEERGGFVCNLAIERRAKVRLMERTGAGSERENQSLARAACLAMNVDDASVTMTSDFPVGAGLGGSSAAGVALAAALAEWIGEAVEPQVLAERSRAVEVAGLRMPGGRQDHYAAAFGGALALTFGAQVAVRRLSLTAATVESLERQLVLVYTGESRVSGETIRAVLDAYGKRVPRVVDALARMKALAIDMASAVERGDVDTLGALVGEHWMHQRTLHPRITTDRIDAIATAASRAGALGMKALGASGGGCVLVVAPANVATRVADAIAGLGEVLSWRVAHTGVVVER